MTEDEKYLFDLNGYLILDQVLTSEELELANEAVDRHIDQRSYDRKTGCVREGHKF